MQLSKLAKATGVAETDVNCLLQSVASAMIKDKAGDVFLAADEDHQTQMVQAYVDHAVKKFQEFKVTMRTNDKARSEFQALVAGWFRA